MFNRAIAICVLIMLAGCYKIEKSPVLTEEAEITEVVYTPSQHGSGTGFGMTGKGTMVMTTNSVNIPEVFAVVFKCKHGKFIIKRKDVWQKAVVGMKVSVRYQEVYKITDKGRALVEYDFLSFRPL